MNYNNNNNIQNYGPPPPHLNYGPQPQLQPQPQQNHGGPPVAPPPNYGWQPQPQPNYGQMPANIAVDKSWPPKCFEQPHVAVRELLSMGIPVATTEYASIGAGMGSFVWTDFLRISGVPEQEIACIGVESKPYGHYKYLTGNSQIPLHERLRSNSESTPDNIWGWPGYAVREIAGELGKGHVGRASSLFWQIFNEPTFTDTYTPVIGNVFKALDREMSRIGWQNIYRYGRVRSIRKTDDGRYAVAYSFRGAPGVAPNQPAHAIHITRYLHLAVGYPAIQVLPDLQKYREETQDYKAVVNAYEKHDHIYEYLRRNGGLVMVRGRGIVASRILQRLYEERAYNPNIGIIHLLRRPVSEGRHYGKSKREVINQFEFQPFNWPRGCWTGAQRKQLEKANQEERKRLLEMWGGTTTAKRKDWIEITRKGLREGWYQIVFGEVERVGRDDQGKLVTVVKANGQVAGQLNYSTNFIIDATGLIAKARSNPLLKDLIDHHGLNVNIMERLQVENDFEVTGMRNGPGRIFAAGAATLGGPNAGVDTFLGLQYAALASIETLRRQPGSKLRPIRGFRSLSQWLRWARGVQP